MADIDRLTPPRLIPPWAKKPYWGQDSSIEISPKEEQWQKKPRMVQRDSGIVLPQPPPSVQPRYLTQEEIQQIPQRALDDDRNAYYSELADNVTKGNDVLRRLRMISGGLFGQVTRNEIDRDDYTQRTAQMNGRIKSLQQQMKEWQSLMDRLSEEYRSGLPPAAATPRPQQRASIGPY